MVAYLGFEISKGLTQGGNGDHTKAGGGDAALPPLPSSPLFPPAGTEGADEGGGEGVGGGNLIDWRLRLRLTSWHVPQLTGQAFAATAQKPCRAAALQVSISSPRRAADLAISESGASVQGLDSFLWVGPVAERSSDSMRMESMAQPCRGSIFRRPDSVRPQFLLSRSSFV